jgi:hypothetical protein
MPEVLGRAFSPTAPGVLGSNASGGNGVRTEVPASSSSNAIAMCAVNLSTYTGGGAAVVGASNGVAGACVSPRRCAGAARATIAAATTWMTGRLSMRESLDLLERIEPRLRHRL